MINNSNEFTRRILFFPAIRSCESVSFSGLLSSLIKLGHSITSFKAKPIFSNKKNATNSIHLIETLLVFLEELQNGGSSRSEISTALCLSELHFIFQKIRFLLEDCTRDGARIWMLMKSEEVSTHFRVLMRAVAVALDVLPPPSAAEIDSDAVEVAEFVRNQALKSEFEVGRDDRRAMRRICRIMEQLECGVAPESIELKRVLRNLGIGSWVESNCEIEFLEGELGHEFGGSEKRGVGFLSSLMAVLIYCRCTLFVSGESVKASSALQKSVGGDGKIGFFKLDDFRCPISLEIMVDPVTITTGQTYERSSITRWFKSGNHTCPVTGERLVSVDVVQNLALRRLIKVHCAESGVRLEESRGRSRGVVGGGGGSGVAERAMVLIAAFLVEKMVAGEDEERNKAAFECRLLTKTSVFNRSCFVEAGAIVPLLNSISISSRNRNDLQENAMAALLNLSKCSRSKGMIVESSGFDLIVGVLNGGVTMEARRHAAGALFYLASVEDNRRIIGRTRGAISGLIELIRDGPCPAKKNAIVAILGLLKYPENHWRVLGGGIVLLLVDLLRSSESEDLVTDSLAILVTLAENLDGAMVVISAGILPLVIEILRNSNSRTAKEYGVTLLLSLCISCRADAVPLLVKDTSLMVSLYALLTDGTSRSRKKAGSLIKILHIFNEKNLMAPTTSPSNGHFVHVW